MQYFIHKNAICETVNIGKGTRVWAFTHILGKARIGRECNICDHVFIENDVYVGDRVTVKSGVQLWDGIRVGDEVFIGPNATFTNDSFPRSKVYPEKFPLTEIEKGASIGGGAVILPGVKVGENAMIGAGAVVTKSVPPNAIVAGVPGRIVGYVDTVEKTSEPRSVSKERQISVYDSNVSGVKLFNMPVFRDIRGSLTVGEYVKDIPFQPKRYFIVFDVPGTHVRGEHAHFSCEQFLICVRGSCHVLVDDGITREEYVLDAASKGIYIPAMVWGTQYKYSSDAVLVVYASDYYNSSDYIREYSRFLQLKRNGDAR